MNGYIKLFRRLLDWQWFNKDYMLRVWVWLLLNARHDDGYSMGVLVRKGQVITGRKKMSKELCLSERQIRTAINRLKSTNELTIESTNQYSLITILKWEEYQGDVEEATNEPTRYQSIERPSNDHQATTKQEGKEGKETTIYIPKHKHGEFSHVLLTDGELEKLVNEYGQDTTDRYIRALDEGIELKGYKYKSHYLAIKKWIKKDGVKKPQEDIAPVYDSSFNPAFDEDRFNEIMRKRS